MFVGFFDDLDGFFKGVFTGFVVVLVFSDTFSDFWGGAVDTESYGGKSDFFCLCEEFIGLFEFGKRIDSAQSSEASFDGGEILLDALH